MKRLAFAFALLPAAYTVLVSGEPGRPPPAWRDPSSHALVFLRKGGPVLIRFHVRAEGRPLREAWESALDRLFGHLDRNGNGHLDRNEADGVMPASMVFGSGFFAAGAPPAFVDLDADRDGKVSRDELAAYYRRSGGAPLQLQLGGGRGPGTALLALGGTGSPSTDRLNRTLLKLLDTNQDGKLSREELAAALATLTKLDADEDEMIAVPELLPSAGRSPEEALLEHLAAAAPMLDATAGPFHAVAPGPTSGGLARRLLTQYRDKVASSGLSRARLGLDATTFARLDRNRDGELDEEELARFADRPAEVEFTVRLGRDSGGVELIQGERPPPKGARLAVAADGAAVLQAGTARLVLRCVPSPPAGRADGALRAAFQARFQEADSDSNGYLDRKEADQHGGFQHLFPMLDRDADGRVFAKEVTAFLDALLDLRTRALGGCVTLAVAEEGRGLFDLFDADHDGRLSVRELRQLGKLVDQLDRNGDGALDLGEIPANYEARFSQGGIGQGKGDLVLVFDVGGGAAARRPERPGPLWFRRMDRNRDGDVSRAEFLGTDEDFRRIDTDADGLIGREEAEAFDRRAGQAPANGP